jgi:hypothetical protein
LSSSTPVVFNSVAAQGTIPPRGTVSRLEHHETFNKSLIGAAIFARGVQRGLADPARVWRRLWLFA